MNKVLDEQAQRAFESDAKVGLLATLDPQGRPHLSLITSLSAKGSRGLVWGQFTEGRSKRYVQANPRVGFLVLTLDRRLWRGKARWTRAERSGEDYERFNRRPMFRYNAYFGIHTVHHMDLLEIWGPSGLPLLGMTAGAVKTALARPLVRGGPDRPVLNPWTRRHLSALTTIKFFSWVDRDGHPTIVPCVPCRPAGRSRLVFAPLVFKPELRQIPAGAQVAVFGLNLQTESVLVRGPFSGWRGPGAARLGVIEVDWVYNSMPPTPGRIYPPVPLEPVRPHRHESGGGAAPSASGPRAKSSQKA
jgi:hypothetical protein